MKKYSFFMHKCAVSSMNNSMSLPVMINRLCENTHSPMNTLIVRNHRHDLGQHNLVTKRRQKTWRSHDVIINAKIRTMLFVSVYTCCSVNISVLNFERKNGFLLLVAMTIWIFFSCCMDVDCAVCREAADCVQETYQLVGRRNERTTPISCSHCSTSMKILSK